MMTEEEGYYSGSESRFIPEREDHDTHLFEYEFEGSTWILEVSAASKEEAERRVAVCSEWGRYLGVGVMTISADRAWWVPAYCWLRNLFRRRD
jgi:hypothetical protein